MFSNFICVVKSIAQLCQLPAAECCMLQLLEELHVMGNIKLRKIKNTHMNYVRGESSLMRY